MRKRTVNKLMKQLLRRRSLARRRLFVSAKWKLNDDQDVFLSSSVDGWLGVWSVCMVDKERARVRDKIAVESPVRRGWLFSCKEWEENGISFWG